MLVAPFGQFTTLLPSRSDASFAFHGSTSAAPIEKAKWVGNTAEHVHPTGQAARPVR